MNLTKLFEVQKVLQDKINYNGPDRFKKLVLSLLVELGECSNEWRGFKFWSKDQKPRTRELVKKAVYGFNGEELAPAKWENPLLIEYVDGLHFILDIGIELGYMPESLFPFSNTDDINDHLINLYFEISDLAYTKNHNDYVFMFRKYLALGEMLDFSWEEIVQAYFEKNAINHQRQEEGY